MKLWEFDTIIRLVSSNTAMAQPAALSKAESVFPELATLMSSGREIDEFSLARFDRAANESMGVAPRTAFQIAGMVAACRWDADAVRANFEMAMQAGGDYVELSNYAAALRSINLASEAAEKIEQAAARAPEQLSYLRDAISTRFCVGDWHLALGHLDTLRSRMTEPDLHCEHLREFVRFSNEIGLLERTVQDSMKVTLEFLTQERVRFAGVKDSVDNLSGDPSAYFDVLVRATEHAADDLDERLTPLLFDGVEDMQLEIFCLAIKPVSDA